MNQHYHKHMITNLIEIKKFVTIHYFEFNKHYEYAGECHDFWEIVYADKNDILITRDDEKNVLLHQGEMIFYKPMQFHALKSNGISAPNVVIISFECNSPHINFFSNKIIKIPKQYLHHISNIIVEAKHTFDLPIFDVNMKKLKLKTKMDIGGQQIIKNCLELLLIMLIREQNIEDSKDAFFIQKIDVGNILVGSIINYLEKNVYSKITLKDVCDQFYFSKTLLCFNFRKYTGYSIMDYFMNLKIIEAKKYLREDILKISQISDKLYFDTPSYFVKVFKRFTEMTPSQYVNSILHNLESENKE